MRAIFDQKATGSVKPLPGVEVHYADLTTLSSRELDGVTVSLTPPPRPPHPGVRPYDPHACLSTQAAFVSMDRGPAEEAGADLANYLPLPTILDSLPSSASVLVAAYANDTMASSGGLPIKLFSSGQHFVIEYSCAGEGWGERGADFSASRHKHRCQPA